MNNEQLKTFVNDKNFLEAIQCHFLESKDGKYFMSVNTHVLFCDNFEQYPVIIIERGEMDRFHIKAMTSHELRIAYEEILSENISIEQLIYSVPSLYMGYLKSHPLVDVYWEDPLIGFILGTFNKTYKNPIAAGICDTKITVLSTPLVSTTSDNNIVKGVLGHNLYNTKLSYAKDVEFYQTEVNGKTFTFRENQYTGFYKDGFTNNMIYSYKSKDHDVVMVLSSKTSSWKVFDFKNKEIITDDNRIKTHPAFSIMVGNKLCEGVYNYDFNENNLEEV